MRCCFRARRDCNTQPIVTLGMPWSNALPCNYHFRELADHIVAELDKRGAKGFVAATPVVADGETMGMEGMRYSLPSRDVIADCIETMHEAYRADAMLCLGGCDKSLPASLMPIARG